MLISFLFLNKNICCGYLLEAPHRGASNEYPQHMFSSRNKKNIMWIPPLIYSYQVQCITNELISLDHTRHFAPLDPMISAYPLNMIPSARLSYHSNNVYVFSGEQQDTDLVCSVSPLKYQVSNVDIKGVYIRFLASSSTKVL